MPLRYGAGVGDNSIRLDAPNPLEQPAPLRTIGPVRAVTTPLGNIVGAPFFVGADTGCAAAEFGVTGSVHITAALGVGLCPPNETLGNAWINNQLVVGADPGGSEALRVGSSARIARSTDGDVLVARRLGATNNPGLFVSVIDAGPRVTLSSQSGLGTPDLMFNLQGTDRMLLTSAALTPATAGGLTLGTSALYWGQGFFGASPYNIVLQGSPTAVQQIMLGNSSVFGVVGSRFSGGDAVLTYNASQDTSSTDRWVQSLAPGFNSWALQITDAGPRYFRAAASQAPGTQAAFWGVEVLGLTTAALRPGTAGGITLGTASLPWGDGFFQDEVVVLNAGTRYGSLNAATNIFSVVAEGASTVLDLFVNGAARWRVNTSGHLLAFADNTYDIGASGANRPRDIFLAGEVIAGVGAVGAPSYSFTGDTNTGIYHSAASQVSVAIGGVELARIFGTGIRCTNGTFVSADNSNGITSTISIVEDGGLVTHTLTFKNGILTNYSTA